MHYLILVLIRVSQLWIGWIFRFVLVTVRDVRCSCWIRVVASVWSAMHWLQLRLLLTTCGSIGSDVSYNTILANLVHVEHLHFITTEQRT